MKKAQLDKLCYDGVALTIASQITEIILAIQEVNELTLHFSNEKVSLIFCPYSITIKYREKEIIFESFKGISYKVSGEKTKLEVVDIWFEYECAISIAKQFVYSCINDDINCHLLRKEDNKGCLLISSKENLSIVSEAI